MKLSEITKALYIYKKTKSIEQIEITGLEMDSRNVKKGDLFICIKGFTVDGHLYARQAEAKGAAAIVAEKPLDVSIPVIIVNDTTKAIAILANKYFEYPTQSLNVIGVTGTNGKTSVTYLLEAIFREHKHRTGLIGTIQMKMGEECFDVKNTTPDSLFLQKSFHQMLERNIDTVFMEVSSHALDIGRVYGCDFDVAVFTNLSQDHLDYHSSMEDYLRAKSLLFAQLGNTYDSERPKFAVINQDDVHHESLIKSTSQPVVTYGIDSEADIRALDVNLDANGATFILKTTDEEIPIKSKLMGKFSIYNMLAATAAALCSGIPLHTIKRALEATTGVSGRFEPVTVGQPFGVIVDYAHTPDSLENVLSTIRSFVKGKVYVVVGCGGDRDKTKRPLMAASAVKYADLSIFTSDNPRSEEPDAIIADMITGIETEKYRVIENRKDAIYQAVELADKDDIVLIAGKGHETYQQIKGDTLDFDDRLVAEEAIKNKIS
ncbi:UDP-N-acetylmuramoyl-L-alanyl-D-glutamate--2,6-diaminopimelate ligase [Sediminibacillus albus]|uniref:UDP-N-acetylmuramoyl-L-alanyl-D-glutamate--2,6-diaminopimelate ligase n=1 Tax=Sediminibacillus albus TaxID=407036 RepID=A0A1G8W7K7_9BACI|nr:UDP-N-acetylmuramoyl-L-alanyl-D-glutamate--2,6-diaminopimelate ligase [Sediminibacillus albus]SDJ74258.1 UDP-N-acetylmuramoyl-L-alanyl-D-glutamate--2,6-diaminopimelate ligase [Sediminibacillus albus]